MEKKLIFTKLKNKISAEGYLQVSAQESRSSWIIKRAIQKLLELVDKALFVPQRD
jgi:ribosome-associated protein